MSLKQKTTIILDVLVCGFLSLGVFSYAQAGSSGSSFVSVTAPTTPGTYTFSVGVNGTDLNNSSLSVPTVTLSASFTVPGVVTPTGTISLSPNPIPVTAGATTGTANVTASANVPFYVTANGTCFWGCPGGTSTSYNDSPNWISEGMRFEIRAYNSGALLDYKIANLQYPPISPYFWLASGWSACSATVCGTTGTKTQTVVCKNNSGTTVADSFCDPLTKPDTIQTCSAPACTADTCNISGPPAYQCGSNSCFPPAYCDATACSCKLDIKYSCASGACVRDDWGPFTDSNCNNTCTGSGQTIVSIAVSPPTATIATRSSTVYAVTVYRNAGSPLTYATITANLSSGCPTGGTCVFSVNNSRSLDVSFGGVSSSITSATVNFKVTTKTYSQAQTYPITFTAVGDPTNCIGTCFATAGATLNLVRVVVPTASLTGTAWGDAARSVVWGYQNSVGPMVVVTGLPFQFNWSSTNATACNIDGKAENPASGGSDNTYTAGGGGWNHTYTLTCTSSTGGSAIQTLNVSVPPNPTGPVSNCSVDGKTGSFSWTKAPGYPYNYVRLCKNNSIGGCDMIQSAITGDTEYYPGSSVSFASEPGASYSWWVHTWAPPYGAWSDVVSGSINCPAPVAVTASISADSASVPYNTSTIIHWSIANSTSASITSDHDVAFASRHTIAGNNPDALDNTSNLTQDTTYTLTAQGYGGPVVKSVTVKVTPGSNSGTKVDGDNSTCEKMKLSWSGFTGPITGYKIYRNTTKSVPASAFATSASSSYADSPGVGTYYYWVSAYNANGESQTVAMGQNPMAVKPCTPDTNNSGKDVVSINGVMTNSVFSSCGSYPAPIPSTMLNSLKIGDNLKFNLRLCNAGDGKATQMKVTDTLVNLKIPNTGLNACLITNGSGSYFNQDGLCTGGTKITQGSGSGHYAISGTEPNQSITFNLTGFDIPPSGAFSLTFDGQLAAIANTGTIGTALNSAYISLNNIPGATFSTQMLRYYLGKGAPIIQEK